MECCSGPRAAAAVLALLAVTATGCTGSGELAGPAAPSPGQATVEPGPSGPAQPAGAPDRPPAAQPVPGPAEPPPGQASDDGTWHAEIVRAQPDALVLDKVEILDGAAAAAARAEDGQTDPSAEVPYIRNRNRQLRTLPVAQDVEVQVIDCPQDGCGLAPWTYADLVAGTPLPYGTPSIPFSVTVADGRVVALSEVYFP